MLNKFVLNNYAESYNRYKTVDSTCTVNGCEYYECDRPDCDYTEEVYLDIIEHNFVGDWIVDKPATCTEVGINSGNCSRCDYSYTVEVPAFGHTDNNGDDNCDVCKKTNLSGKPQDPTIICTCNCHKTGIRKLLFKIVFFFQKFLRLNKTCACGVAHY